MPAWRNKGRTSDMTNKPELSTIADRSIDVFAQYTRLRRKNLNDLMVELLERFLDEHERMEPPHDQR
jgi:hypothetical protein